MGLTHQIALKSLGKSYTIYGLGSCYSFLVLIWWFLAFYSRIYVVRNGTQTIRKWSHYWSCVNCWTNKSWQFGLKNENMFVSVYYERKGRDETRKKHKRIHMKRPAQTFRQMKFTGKCDCRCVHIKNSTNCQQSRTKHTHTSTNASHKKLECLLLLFAYCIYGVRLCVLSVFILLFIQKWTNFYFTTFPPGLIIIYFLGFPAIILFYGPRCICQSYRLIGVPVNFPYIFQLAFHCHINTFRREIIRLGRSSRQFFLFHRSFFTKDGNSTQVLISKNPILLRI